MLTTFSVPRPSAPSASAAEPKVSVELIGTEGLDQHGRWEQHPEFAATTARLRAEYAAAKASRAAN